MLCISARETKVGLGRGPEPSANLNSRLFCLVQTRFWLLVYILERPVAARSFNPLPASLSLYLHLGILCCHQVSAGVGTERLRRVSPQNQLPFRRAGMWDMPIYSTSHLTLQSESKKDNMSAPVSVWHGGKIAVLSEATHPLVCIFRIGRPLIWHGVLPITPIINEP